MKLKENEKFFLVRMWHESGWSTYYVQTTKEKVMRLIRKRGADKIVLRLHGEEEYKEYTLKEFEEL